MTVKLRIEGPPAEVATVAALLGRTVNVVDESRDHPNRKRNLDHVRRYLTLGDLKPGPWQPGPYDEDWSLTTEFNTIEEIHHDQ